MDWNEPKLEDSFNVGITEEEFKKHQHNAKMFIVDELVPWFYEKIRKGNIRNGGHMMYAIVATLAGSAMCLTYGKMFGKPGAVNEAVRGLCGMAVIDLEATIDSMEDGDVTKSTKLLTVKKMGDLGPSIYHASKTKTKEEVVKEITGLIEVIYDLAKSVDKND